MKPRIISYPGDNCTGKEISSLYGSYMVWLVYQNLMMAFIEKLKHVAIVNKMIFFTSNVVLAEESVLVFIPDYLKLASAI